jgi:hypothetical protein
MVILDPPNPIHTILELESPFTYQKHSLLHICQPMNYKENIQNKPLEVTMENGDKGVKGFHLFQENEPKKLNPREFVEMVLKMRS